MKIHKKHELKILPVYYHACVTKLKRFEIRKCDRDYQIGDYVALCEWNGKEFTGNVFMIQIIYILKNVQEYGLKDGFCIFGW